MKHLISRRRKSMAVWVSIFACLFLVVCFELGKERYQENFRAFIKQKLEESLGSSLIIESIEGGIFRSIVLHGLRFNPCFASGPSRFEIDVDKAFIDYGLWDLVIKRLNPEESISLRIEGGKVFGKEGGPRLTGLEGRMVLYKDTVKTENLKAHLGDAALTASGLITNLSQQPRINLCLEAGHPYLNGRVNLKDSLFKPSFEGSFNLFNNQVRVECLGDISEQGVNITSVPNLENDQVKIRGTFAWSSDFEIFAKLNHLNAGEFDILSDIEIKGKVVKDEKAIKAELKTTRSIVNYKPFEELRAYFQVTASAWEILSFTLGDSYCGSGRVDLARPYEVEFSLQVKDEDIDDIIAVFGGKDEKNIVSGLMNGELNIKGPLSSPDIKGHFSVVGGNLAHINFNSADVNLVGRGLEIQVTDSRLFREDGFLELEGEIDLSALGGPGEVVDLRLKSDQETVAWKGWDITRRKNSPNLSLQKKVNEDCLVSVKTFMNDESMGEDANATEFGLEYTVMGNKSLKMQLRETEEFLVLEHKLKF